MWPSGPWILLLFLFMNLLLFRFLEGLKVPSLALPLLWDFTEISLSPSSLSSPAPGSLEPLKPQPWVLSPPSRAASAGLLQSWGYFGEAQGSGSHP